MRVRLAISFSSTHRHTAVITYTFPHLLSVLARNGIGTVPTEKEQANAQTKIGLRAEGKKEKDGNERTKDEEDKDHETESKRACQFGRV